MWNAYFTLPTPALFHTVFRSVQASLAHQATMVLHQPWFLSKLGKVGKVGNPPSGSLPGNKLYRGPVDTAVSLDGVTTPISSIPCRLFLGIGHLRRQQTKQRNKVWMIWRNLKNDCHLNYTKRIGIYTTVPIFTCHCDLPMFLSSLSRLPMVLYCLSSTSADMVQLIFFIGIVC